MGNDKAEREKRSNPRPTSEPRRGASASNFTPIVWASVSFTPDQKARLKSTDLDAEKALDTLAWYVEQGHKLSINPSTSDGFIGVSLWGHTDNCPNKGYGVSGEGGSLGSALKSLLGKLDILQGDLRIEQIRGDDDFR